MKIKLCLFLGLALLASGASAKTVWVNGRPCMQMRNSQVVCPANLAERRAAYRQERATRFQQQRAILLQECLSQSREPGAPERSECRQMYGAN